MNVSYRWLQELAPSIKGTPQELADRLAMLGAPVDEIVTLGEPLRDIVIARVKAVQRHPNADRLSLCEVDAGNGKLLQVVCGAPNVRADAYYPFAPVGAELPGGMVIRQTKIRGTESQGMLCSARELGLGRDHEGILELHGSFHPGESFIQAVGLDDARIVIDVTPNRPDLLSHWGIARELAARGEADLRRPSIPGKKAAPEFELARSKRQGKADSISIRIDDADACPRYIGVAIRDVKIGPSPDWLASRLRAIGARPINNVVDATNFVLHELGQPLHAFDLDLLEDQEIIVRRARAGEQLTTLDGEQRKLQDTMLVIADGKQASAIAGVMGGQQSEVSDKTTNLLLECALFEPKQVRNTRRALGLITDASQRFERGVDPDGMERAVQRALALIVATAGGRVTGATDVYPHVIKETTIKLRPARVAHVLGTPLKPAELRKLLEPIGFSVAANGSAMKVSVPGHRRYDVAREIDLIEEVARRRGYDNFPVELLPFRPSAVPEDPLAQLESRLRELLVARGFLEARTGGFAPEDEGDVALLLPMSAAETRLRRALLPGLLRRVGYNFSRGVRHVRIFEIGTAFAPGADLPVETTRIAVVFTGARTPPHWSGSEALFDIWDLKALMEEVAGELGISDVEPVGAGELNGIAATVANVLESELALRGGPEGAALAYGGRLRRERIDAPAWSNDVFGFELLLPAAGVLRERTTYTPVPVYPAIEQDIALVLPDSLTSAAVEATICAAGGPLLEGVTPFDLYQGQGIPEGTRSIAYRLRFRASDRTLTDQEADRTVQRILQRVREEHGVERRG